MGGHPVANNEGKIAHRSRSDILQSYKIQTSEEVKVDNSNRNIQKLVTDVILQEHEELLSYFEVRLSSELLFGLMNGQGQAHL